MSEKNICLIKKNQTANKVAYFYLRIKGDGARLTFGTDAFRPGCMSLTARFNFATDVLQVGEFSP